MGWGGVGTGGLASAGTVVLPSLSSTPSWIARIISSVQSRGYIPWDRLCTKMLKATHSPETSVPPLLLVESRRHVSLPWRPALQAVVASRSLLWCQGREKCPWARKCSWLLGRDPRWIPDLWDTMLFQALSHLTLIENDYICRKWEAKKWMSLWELCHEMQNICMESRVDMIAGAHARNFSVFSEYQTQMSIRAGRKLKYMK